jgi:uroporphyrinogen decarboxylase
MDRMTTRERVQRMFAHQEADRIPITDSPWGATIERWVREGMPKETSYVDYFGLDDFQAVAVDVSPRYEAKVLEETQEYVVYTSPYGVTMKSWKHAASTPEFLDFTIKTPADWRKAKARMTPTPDRLPLEHLRKEYPKWRERGSWIQAGFWFGFDITHSWTVGTERVLMALVEEPEWMSDMFNHFLDMNIALFDQVWDAGFTFDGIGWPDDMGYKYHQFFSIETYRELLKPVHKRAIDWAHARGIKAALHSCGDIRPLVPELIDIGLDALNPLEVKAGMNPVALKKQYGRNLVFQGGINAVLWDQKEKIEAEMKRTIPVMKEHGGYIFSSDHSVPSSVSLENFRYITDLAKKLGKY